MRWHTDRRGGGAEDGAMNSPSTSIAQIYTRWLKSFWAIVPGFELASQSEESARKQEQAAAAQEWEDEGGSVKP